MSFPPGTEMFQFPGFASTTYVFSCRYPIGVGCPIRISTDQRLLAAPRGFSQRATSFIASWCQGIHRMPFLRSRSPIMRRSHPGPAAQASRHREEPPACGHATRPRTTGSVPRASLSTQHNASEHIRGAGRPFGDKLRHPSGQYAPRRAQSAPEPDSQ